MKKLVKFLLSFSIVANMVSMTTSCNGSLGFSSSYTNEQKILSITSLTTSLFEKYDVKLMSKLDEDNLAEWKKLIINLYANTMGYTFTGEEELTKVLDASLTQYVMANILLNEVAAKIPALSWINNKVKWQAAKWNYTDLVDAKSPKQPIAKNAAGWISDDEWSLSVTFLNSDKTGSQQGETPFYARINVNKKIALQDNSLEVDTKNSNPYSFWRTSDGNVPDAITPIANSSATQTKNYGVIYQGFVNSSTLIDLSNIIYNSDKNYMPSSFLDFTPSVVDMVNNINIEDINY
ncbi:hypothetical protein SHELI_v1c11100 [Spiroplasma helicoides]|uniref:Lipoprotein n=1 Tax=Spiroplasma helicoides TaxID=216938 RepID=A0A1B3SMB5_9MOLU|nr:hypothetical protein [Spiroplasma helicoides]AOG61057.1 hypothetical protein SHELI_v1c11100 [Spiroplasma helicoides]